MNFRDQFDAEVASVLRDEVNDVVELRAAGTGAPFSLPGKFGDDYIPQTIGDGVVHDGTFPFFEYRAADRPAGTYDDTVKFKGEMFRVVGVQPRGVMRRLILEKL